MTSNLRWLALAGLLLATGCASTGSRTVSENAPGAWAGVIEAMQAGDYARAEQKLLSLQNRNGSSPGVLANLGIVYARTDRVDEAEQALKQSLTLNDSAAVWNELGLLYRRSGRFPDAETAYLSALRVTPDYAYARRNLAVLYDLYLQKPGDALAQYVAYRDLIAGETAEVDKWIADLSRRVPEAAAAVGRPQ